jgi:hypothetical protein
MLENSLETICTRDYARNTQGMKAPLDQIPRVNCKALSSTIPILDRPGHTCRRS